MRFAVVTAIALAFAHPASAQAPSAGMASWTAEAKSGSLPLYPTPMGSPDTEQWYGNSFAELSVRNVTSPTITPFLPDAGKANGAAVVVVPGGGNYFVSLGNEGIPVARWLAERGVAAFVVKYRSVPTPRDEPGFAASWKDSMTKMIASKSTMVLPGEENARKDVQQALRFVKSGASRWGLDPNRIGLVGFSAGSIATLNTVLADAPDARPAFAGLIYGRMVPVKPPKSLPPIFVALAADDPLFGKQGIGVVDSWQAAGGSAELHYYASGGHGFGMKQQGKSSDGWAESFCLWLKDRGFIK